MLLCGCAGRVRFAQYLQEVKVSVVQTIYCTSRNQGQLVVCNVELLPEMTILTLIVQHLRPLKYLILLLGPATPVIVPEVPEVRLPADGFEVAVSARVDGPRPIGSGCRRFRGGIVRVAIGHVVFECRSLGGNSID